MTPPTTSRPRSGDWSEASGYVNANGDASRSAAAQPSSVSQAGSTPSVLPTSQDSSRIESSAAGEDSFPSSISSTEPSTTAQSTENGTIGEAHAGSKTESPSSNQGTEDLNARIEKKRFEHEQQRALQRKAFEQQMALLEMQQQEEERNLLQQQQHKGRPERGQLDHVIASAGANAASSAPSTPSRETNMPRHQQLLGNRQKVEARPHGPTVLGSVQPRTEPEEGLNGSNVPGLAPSSTSANYHRSMPASRRQSQDGHPDAMPQGRLAAALANQRRGAPQQELTGAFEKMGLGGGPRGGLSAAHLRSQLGSQDPARGPARQGLADGSAQGGGANAASSQNLQQGNGEGFTPVFNERFLFDDELDNEDSAFVKRYNLQEDDDKFPILVRRDSFPDVLSASSAALDLAPLAQAAKNVRVASGSGVNEASEWPQFSSGGSVGARDRSSRQAQGDAGVGEDTGSVDPSRRAPGQTERTSPSGHGSRATGGGNAFHLPTPSPRVSQNARDSPAVHVGFHAPSSSARSGALAPVSPSPAGSTNLSNGSRFANHMSQHDFMGHSDFDPLQPQPSATARKADVGSGNSTATGAGGLKPHGGATPRDNGNFPSFSLGAFSNASGGSESPSRFGPYSPAAFDGDSTGRAPSNSSRPNSGFFDAFNPAVAAAPHHHHNVFGSSAGLPLAAGGGSSSLKHARKAGNVGAGGELDAGTRLEDLQGEIFALCKDQHGCRYLQKKLEEGLPTHRDMIFAETFHHFAELMTDPFGNYLCQKMLEYCTDEQRNRIVESVAPELVTISLNMHGTRAVQKTIDFLSTSRQIHSIIMALSMNVVTLIKDLNGNHVIQKCLNRLGAEDNQFIYNAVAAHCVEVATHRHGCCVLQRCIDHASDSQRVQLVAEITYNALTLVQDPFGNYVVQYVLDLCDQRFTDAVIRQFVGNVCLLSVQKFSSNVIEKCIRVSDPSIRKQLIEELLNRSKLEKLLRDSFANYVVQTSLDYADPVQRMRLVECIRPILPVIRNTPYGKRIQSKLQRDNLDLGPSANPASGGLPYSLLHQAAHHQHHHHQQQLQAMAMMAANNRNGNPADFMSLNAYGQPGMQPLPPPLPHHYGPGPGARGAGHHQPQHHVPPHLQQQQQAGQHHNLGPHHQQPYGGAGATGGLSHHQHPHHPNAGHSLPPPMSFTAPNSAHPAYAAAGHYQGGGPPPPMGIHVPSGSFPSSSSGGFGPY